MLEWYFGPPQQAGVTFSGSGAVLGLPSTLPPGTRFGPGGRAYPGTTRRSSVDDK